MSHPSRPAPGLSAPRETSALALSSCPECGAPAEVLDRFVVESTDGPVEELKLRCLQRHHFLLPAYLLERN